MFKRSMQRSECSRLIFNGFNVSLSFHHSFSNSNDISLLVHHIQLLHHPETWSITILGDTEREFVFKQAISPYYTCLTHVWGSLLSRSSFLFVFSLAMLFFTFSTNTVNGVFDFLVCLPISIVIKIYYPQFSVIDMF